ncbi:thiol:disulfide interchange protein TlpA [Bosea sp. (in: a-proteobacteria)]|jgi:thiol-disulfide isomerase/thioredoxin|uniref:thiol:disulfide interchange protein TlpA n=1 Tax=Bosea sp. (in: a-proteobacteria) TaxID=1871050 RepID=UPI003F6F1B53
MTSRSKKIAAAGIVSLIAIGSVAAFYSLQSGAGNSRSCAANADLVDKLRPLARGEVAAVEVAKTPRPLPDLTFNGPDGQPTTLSAFKGRTVLVNLWATWCLPCLHEMPALDALQGALGGPDFSVVAVNIDTRDLDKPKKWLAKREISRLTYYADPQATVFQDLRAARKIEGMPVSVLVDASGCELAMLQGPADWASQDALAFVRAALGR